MDEVYEELSLPRGSLPPGAEVGNILTGETFDVSKMAMSLALFYCPFCGVHLVEDYPEDLDSSSGP